MKRWQLNREGRERELFSRATKNSRNSAWRQKGKRLPWVFSPGMLVDWVEKSIPVCTISRLAWIQALLPTMNTIPTPSCCLIERSHIVIHLSPNARGHERTIPTSSTTSWWRGQPPNFNQPRDFRVHKVVEQLGREQPLFNLKRNESKLDKIVQMMS